MDGQHLARVLNQDPCIQHQLRDPGSIIGIHTLEDLNTSIASKRDPRSTIAIIVNTEPNPNKEGEHWVSIYSDAHSPDGLMDYFDPLGLPPRRQNFYHFFNRQERAWQYNKHCLQFPLSSVCGYYCLYFLLQRCRGTDMNTIGLQFGGSSRIENDAKVQNFIHKHYQVKKTDRFMHLKNLVNSK